MDAVWHRVETAAMSETARIMLFDRAAAALSDHIADLLRIGGHTCEPSKLVADLQSGVAELTRDTESLLSGEIRAQSGRMRGALIEAGAPEAEAAMVAKLQDLDGVVGIARLARDSGSPARTITAAFADLGAQMGLDWAQQTAARMNPSDPWERLLVNGLARDFQQMRLDFLRRKMGRKGDAAAAVADWAQTHAEGIAQFRKVIARAHAAVPVAPAMLAQIASQARNLLGR
jgi:glutamate dehydrogenase